MVLQERKSAMTAISPITSISQGHLNIWEICRRKYQYSFLEVLSLPEADLDRKEKLQLGAKFHLLMQQKELGLDISALAGSEAQLQTWLGAFEKQPPMMIAGDRLCEHRRTLEISSAISMHDDSENRDRDQGYFVLTAIYDMLILGDRQAQILDWKTHQVAIPLHTLKANWQTRLYLYLLAQTTKYDPEQISMTYWFANSAQSVIIEYSRSEHEQTATKLQQILIEMSQAQTYPKLDLHSLACKNCEFRDRCDRGDFLTSNVLNNIEDIPEIAI
jgi:CRISPR/Cas system-associated exonuclease Cas4 (RecB family)